MPSARTQALVDSIPAEERRRLSATRRDLHENPELGFEEARTSRLVAERLASLGFSPRTGVGRTGVTADPGSAVGKRILLRADMDALPLDEETGAPYASRSPGRMHACGHDGHVAIALAMAGRLAGSAEASRLRLLYQPAEEGAGGAAACAADGVLEGVSAAFGLHLWNQLPVGKIGVRRGPLMAAVDEFSIDVVGPGGHGAAPHETRDAILAAARIVDALQSIVAREVSPLDPAVVSIGSIHGGEAFNVLPSRVRMTGTARWFTESAGRLMPDAVARIARGTAEAAGVRAEVRYRHVNRPTVNDPTMADLVIRVATELLGEENVDTGTRTLGGEDMSIFLDAVPGCFFFVGSALDGAHRPHHSPIFDFDERAMSVGLTVFEAVAREAAKTL
jgi:amidohydrolase